MKVSPEGAIKFMKLCVALSCSWPPSRNASKLQTWSFEFFWWVTFAASLLLEIPVLCAVYAHRADLVMMTKVVCTSSGIGQIILKMLVCRIQRERFQILTEEMETFLKYAKMYEREILNDYVNRYALFHGVAAVGFYTIAVVISCGPLLLPQAFPMDAEYPFNVNKQPASAIVYFQQCLGVFQSSATCMTDCQLAIIIWFTAARFRILAVDLENVIDESKLEECIRKHCHLLRYAQQVNITVRFTALTTVFVSTISIICAGIQIVAIDQMFFIQHQPLFMKMQYGTVVAIGSVDLFIYTWPANNLTETSVAVGWSAYSSPWIGKSPKMLKSLLILFLRSQKSVVISIGGILPELSLGYYAKFLSSVFSYFTTLRLMVDNETS